MLAAAALCAPALARADVRPVGPQSPTHGVTPLHTRAMAISRTGAGTAVTHSGALVYHGGAVMQSSNVVAVYWRPAGWNGGTIADGFRSIVDGYLGNVATDHGRTSNVYSDAVQYGTNYAVTYGGSFIDTNPLPAGRDTGPPNDCADVPLGEKCLSDLQVINEVAAFAGSHGIAGDSGVGPPHPTKMIVFFLPPGVDDCFTDVDGVTHFCSANGTTDRYYCAYHEAFTDGAHTWSYANMPYVWNLGGCQEGQSPNGNIAADGAVSVTSHEFMESMTDPYGDGWWDENGYEIADKCDGQYGTSLGTIAGLGDFNQAIGTGHYWTQLEYSNALADCYQVGPPTITSFSPDVGVAGDTVDVTGANLFGPLVVRFNGIVAGVDTVHSTSTDAKIVLPSGNLHGPVTVQALGGSATSTTSFFPGPAIGSLSPLDGVVGTQVTITGTRLVGVTSVSFGSIGAAFTPVSATQLTATVPPGFSSGKVTVVTRGGSGVSTDTFAITRATGLSISSGQARRTVLVFGQGLGSATGVQFSGSTSVTPVAAAATKVTVLVPPDATTGPVTVVTPRAVVDGPVFRPLPTVTGFSPLAAARGATVTITGANLSGATSVRFGSLAAGSFTVVSPTQITATVPSSNAFTGGRVTVATANGSASSSQSLIVRR